MPHISLVFREMWDTTVLHRQPSHQLTRSSTEETCQTCEEIFRPGNLGSDTITANMQGLLTINYRCEGIAALKQVKVENANNQTFKLSCSDVDRFVGSYSATPETAAVLFKPAWATALPTARDCRVTDCA